MIVLPILLLTVVAPVWIIFHYVTQWKQAKTLTGEDEKLLDDLYDLARRLDDRLCTIERIMNAENPEWRQTCLPDTSVSIPDSFSRTRTRSGERA
jgi:phage shock protein B